MTTIHSASDLIAVANGNSVVRLEGYDILGGDSLDLSGFDLVDIGMFPRSAAESDSEGITVTLANQQSGSITIITLVNVYTDDFPSGVDISTLNGLSTALQDGIGDDDLETGLQTSGPAVPATIVDGVLTLPGDRNDFVIREIFSGLLFTRAGVNISGPDGFDRTFSGSQLSGLVLQFSDGFSISIAELGSNPTNADNPNSFDGVIGNNNGNVRVSPFISDGDDIVNTPDIAPGQVNAINASPGDDLYNGRLDDTDRVDYLLNNRGDFLVTRDAQGVITVTDNNPANGDLGTDTLIGIDELVFRNRAFIDVDDFNFDEDLFDPDPPVFNPNTDEFGDPENTPDVSFAVTAEDPGGAITYTIDGADAQFFNINSTDGTVTLNSELLPNGFDFEAASANGDDIYNFTVTATDVLGASATQDVRYTVSDVDERPTSIDLPGERSDFTIREIFTPPSNIRDGINIVGPNGFELTIEASNLRDDLVLQFAGGSSITIDELEAGEVGADDGSGFDGVVLNDATSVLPDLYNLNGDDIFNIPTNDLGDGGINTIIPNAGNDQYNAGILTTAANGQLIGIESVNYEFARNDFRIVRTPANTIIITDINTGDGVDLGTDTFRNIDFVSFTDTGPTAIDDIDFDEDLLDPDAINTPPVFVPTDGDFGDPENTPGVSFSVAATDANDGDIITYSIDGPDAQFFIISDDGTVTLNSQMLPNGFDFEAASANGDDVYNFTVTATDLAGATATQDVRYTVTNVNEAPEARDDTLQVTAGETTTIDVAELLDNDIDVDDDNSNVNLRVSAVSDTGQDIAVSLVNNNTQIQIVAPFAGTSSFTYTVEDQAGLIDTATVDVTVVDPDAVNTPPVFVPTDGDFGDPENTPDVSFSVAATDVDENDVITYSIDGPDAQFFIISDDGTVTLNSQMLPNGFDFEAASANGDAIYDFTVTATDLAGATATQDVRYTVSNVDEPTDSSVIVLPGDRNDFTIREVYNSGDLQRDGINIAGPNGFERDIDEATIAAGVTLEFNGGVVFTIAELEANPIDADDPNSLDGVIADGIDNASTAPFISNGDDIAIASNNGIIGGVQLTASQGDDQYIGRAISQGDTVIYGTTSLDDYSFSRDANGVITVTDNNLANGDFGTDTLVNINTIRVFPNIDIDVDDLDFDEDLLDNTAPVFNPTDGEFGDLENTPDVSFSVAATDVNEGDIITYSIDGPDVRFFNISDDGTVTLNSQLLPNGFDFENASANNDDVYEFTVTAVDIAGELSTQDVRYTVGNVAEAGDSFIGDRSDFVIREVFEAGDLQRDGINIVGPDGFEQNFAEAELADLVLQFTDEQIAFADIAFDGVISNGQEIVNGVLISDGDDIVNSATLGGATITSSLGADEYNGAALSSDSISYAGSDAGVTVNFETGQGFGGHAEGDTFSNIDDFEGSRFNDDFTGDITLNRFAGLEGDDTFDGRGGADIATYLFERASYSVTRDLQGVITVTNLETGRVDEGTDTLINVEVIFFGTGIGAFERFDVNESEFDQDDLDLVFVPFPGDRADFVIREVFEAGDLQRDGINIVGPDGFEQSFAEAELADLVLQFTDEQIAFADIAFDGVIASDQGAVTGALISDGDDIVNAPSGGSSITSSLGADEYNGAPGAIDSVDYTDSDTGVTINFETGQGFGGDAEGDTFSNIDDITGSRFDDDFTGDDSANTLLGRDGNDIFDGRGGDDTAEYFFDRSTYSVTRDLQGVITVTNQATDRVDEGVNTLTNVEFLRFGVAQGQDETFNVDDFEFDQDDLDLVFVPFPGDRSDFVIREVFEEGDIVRDGINIVGPDGFEQNFPEAELADLVLQFNEEQIAFADIVRDGVISNNRPNGFASDGDDIINAPSGGSFVASSLGADEYNGAPDAIDAVNYNGSNAGVTINFETGQGFGGHAEGDTFSNIENIFGSGFSDNFTGDEAANIFAGDVGNDIFDGRGGEDTAQFFFDRSTYSVTRNSEGVISVRNQDPSRLDEGVDSLTNVEFLEFGDGGLGSLERFSVDEFEFDEDETFVVLQGTRDEFVIRQVFNGTSDTELDAINIERPDGTVQVVAFQDIANTVFAFDDEQIPASEIQFDGSIAAGVSEALVEPFITDGDDIVEGLLTGVRIASSEGADQYSGSATATDSVDYEDSTAGVTVNLETGESFGGHAEGDTFSEIDDLQGSEFVDTFTGDANNNLLEGRGGNDFLDGGDGRDVARYTSGSRSDYQIARDASGAVTVNHITSLGSGDGFDTLRNIEVLQFGDDVRIDVDDIDFDDGPGPLRPVAQDDSIEVVPGTATLIEASTFLANDVDPNDVDSRNLRIIEITSDTPGISVSLVSDGNQVLFTTAEDFIGPATFTYTITDETNLTDTATITASVNQAPVFNLVETEFGNPENTPDDTFLVAAQDPGDVLIYSLGGDDAQFFNIDPSTGLVSLDPVLVDGGFDFENPQSANGNNTYELTVTATDTAGNSTSQDVTYTPTDVDEDLDPIAPNARNDSINAGANTTRLIDVATLLVNDIDPNDGDNSNLSVISVASNSPSISVSLINNNTQILLVTSAGFESSATFSYTVVDETGLTDTATVTVSDAVNTAPVFNLPNKEFGDPENTPDATFTVAAQDPGDVLTYSLSGDDAQFFNIDPSTGVITLDPVQLAEGFDFENPQSADGDNTYELIVTATDTSGAHALQKVTYTPTDVDDGPSPLAPDARDDDVLVEENTGTLIDVATLLANDIDLNDGDNRNLRITAVATDALDITVSLVNNDSQVLIVTPENFVGRSTFTYTVADETDLTDTATVTASVDMPTVLNARNDSIDVAENTATLINVATLLVNDIDPSDGDISNLSIIDVTTATPEITVSLVNNNTQILLVTSADFDGPATFTYTVADNEADVTDTATVTVREVLVDAPPVFNLPNTEFGDPENTPNATFTVAAQDPGDTLTYSLGGADAQFFNIDPSTGVITLNPVQLAEGFDFETPQSANGDNIYELTITATDTAGNSASQVVTYTPTDVDEESGPLAPIPLDDEIDVLSGTANLIDVAILLANDTDLNDGDNRNLRITEVIASSPEITVSLVSDGSQILLVPQAGFSGTATFTYTVADETNLTSTATVSVNVSDVVINTPPVFNLVDTDFGDPENTPDATFTVAAQDPGDTLTYSLGGVDAQFFNIDPSTGVITLDPVQLAEGFDFETPQSANGDNTYQLTITATDLAGASASQDVTYTPTDVDEGVVNAPPVFNLIDTDFGDPENTPDATFTVAAQDPGDTLTYSLGGVDAQFFNIDPSTGVITLDPVQLAEGFDFETPQSANGDNTYQLTITATDLAGASASQDVTYTPTDVDEGPVPLAPSPLDDEIDVEAGVDNLIDVAILLANDRDPNDEDNSNLRVIAVATDTPNIGVSLVNNNTQILLVPQDGFSGPATFTYVVADETNLTDTATVFVNVSDVVINTPPVFNLVDTEFGDPENTPDATFTVAAQDPGDTLTYSLGGADAQFFNIDPSTGVITLDPVQLAEGFDFETPQSANGDNTYQLTITATDLAGASASQDVTYTPTDVDEGPVPLAPSPLDDEIDVEAGVDNLIDVAILLANDRDPNDEDNSNLRVIAVATDTPNIGVSLVNNNTQILLVPQDGFSGPATFTYVVADETNLTDTATVFVNVSDVVINTPPVFNLVDTEFGDPENTPDATFTVAAQDPGDTLTYSLGGVDAQFFNIDPSTGVITLDPVQLAEGFDFETPQSANGDNTYQLTITATDLAGASASQDVTYTPTDVDEGPVPLAPSPLDDEIDVEAGVDNLIDVAILLANDRDPNDEDNSNLRVIAVATDTPNIGVSLVNNNTQILLVPQDGFSGPATFTYVVADETNLTDTATVSVNVSDVVINAPPVFNLIDTDFGDPENTPDATFTVAAQDPGDTLTYSLGGVDAQFFNIDPSTGVITLDPVQLAEGFDFETPQSANGDNTYQLTITATDLAGASASQDVTYTPTDVDEGVVNAPPVFNLIDTEFGDPENTPDATFTVAAQDPGDTLIYTLGGADAQFFTINFVTGAITLNSFLLAEGFDFENPQSASGDNTYQLTITATDTAGNTASQDVTYTPTDVDEGVVNTPPVFNLIDTEFGDPENTPNATFTVAAQDPGDTLTYSLGGADAQFFNIDPSTGVITLNPVQLAEGFDFETPQSANGDNTYQLTITATDLAGASASQDVTYTPTDVVEGPVPLAPSPLDDEIDVEAGVVSLIDVATLLANDSDPNDEDNSNLRFVGFINSSPDIVVTAINNEEQLQIVTAEGFSGPATFTYTVADETNLTDTATVTVNVAAPNPDNTAPVFNPIPDVLEISENAPNATVLLNARDDDGDVLTYSLSGTDAQFFNVDQQTGEVRSTNPNGFDFEAPTDANGDNFYDFIVTASDGTDVTSEEVRIEILDVDETVTNPLVAVGDNGNNFVENPLLEFPPVTFTEAQLLANDQTGNGAEIIGTINARNGDALFDPQTREITFTPIRDHVGPADFVYLIRDQGGQRSQATVTLDYSATPVIPEQTGTVHDLGALFAASGSNDLFVNLRLEGYEIVPGERIDFDGFQFRSIQQTSEANTQGADGIILQFFSPQNSQFINLTIADVFIEDVPAEALATNNSITISNVFLFGADPFLNDLGPQSAQAQAAEPLSREAEIEHQEASFDIRTGLEEQQLDDQFNQVPADDIALGF